jgi:hypothetical protein
MGINNNIKINNIAVISVKLGRFGGISEMPLLPLRG